MSRICLDTSGYSNLKRGHEPALLAVTAARTVFVPAIVLGELRAGFGLGRRQHENEVELRSFLANPVVSVLDVDDETSVHYGELICELRRIGRPLPTNDVWIAATALRAGATVVTYDKHFLEVPTVGTRLLER